MRCSAFLPSSASSAGKFLPPFLSSNSYLSSSNPAPDQDPPHPLQRPHAPNNHGRRQTPRPRLHGQRSRRPRRLRLRRLVQHHPRLHLRQILAQQPGQQPRMLNQRRLLLRHSHRPDRLHHLRRLLDHRMDQKHHPLHRRRRLRQLVLLRRQAGWYAPWRYQGRFQARHDLFLWQHQFRLACRRSHQYAPPGLQHCAEQRGCAGQSHRCDGVLLLGLFDWHRGLGGPVYQPLCFFTYRT